MSIHVASASTATVVVAVDAGKNTVALSVTDAELLDVDVDQIARRGVLVAPYRHRRRRQDSLGRLTPVEYETIMTTPAAQAA